MNLAIIGSRSFNDYILAYRYFDKNFYQVYNSIKIISGGAIGADAIAKRLWTDFLLDFEEIPAKWNDLKAKPCIIGINKFGKKYNKLAGMNRNIEIIEKCDEVLAFWDGKSPGTKDSLNKAEKLDKKTHIVRF